jgi:hypothetical protein
VHEEGKCVATSERAETESKVFIGGAAYLMTSSRRAARNCRKKLPEAGLTVAA